MCNFNVLKTWDYAQTISYSEKLQIAAIKAEKIPGNIFCLMFRRSESRPAGAFCADKIVFWARKATKLYFEPESRPAGGFWAKYLISCESKVACIFFEKSPRVLEIMFCYCEDRSRCGDVAGIFIIEEGVFCVELRPCYWNKRISVPMSYISWLDISQRVYNM